MMCRRTMTFIFSDPSAFPLFLTHQTVCVCVFCPGLEDVMEYDPNLLSDPQWPCGKHKRVLVFASYMVRGRVFVVV